MNALSRHLEEQAKKGFRAFIVNLETACPHLKRKFQLREQDEEHIDIDIDRYQFTLTWAEEKKQSIGREISVVVFDLCTWNTEGGGRWHPPEVVDVQLIKSQSILDCIKCVLETVATEEIRQCLEGVGYEVMEKLNETKEEI